jgi:hypothetical protein
VIFHYHENPARFTAVAAKTKFYNMPAVFLVVVVMRITNPHQAQIQVELSCVFCGVAMNIEVEVN